VIHAASEALKEARACFDRCNSSKTEFATGILAVADAAN
jgi:hypothetical protein